MPGYDERRAFEVGIRHLALGVIEAHTTAGDDLLLQSAMIASVLAAACLASVVIGPGLGLATARALGSPRARMAFHCPMAGLLVLSLVPAFW